MSKQVYVFKDENYGSSKTSSAVNTALKPNNLREGAIGIYGIQRSSSIAKNNGKLVLITDGGSESAGLVPATSFNGESIIIYQGVKEGISKSPEISINSVDLFKITTQAYISSVKQVAYIGYNIETSSGTLSLPSSIVKNDEAILRIGSKTKDRINMTGSGYSGYAVNDGSSSLSILYDLVKRVALDRKREVDVQVVGELGSKTAFANPANVEYESKIVNMTAHSLTTGTIITLLGAFYTISEVINANSFALDTIYLGDTATIAVLDADSGVFDQSAIDENNYGLKVIDKDFNNTVNVGSGGILENSSRTIQTSARYSTNSGQQVKNYESSYRSYKGTLDVHDTRNIFPDLTADVNKNYDSYYIRANNITSDSDASRSVRTADKDIYFYFEEDVADTAGKNQADFEDIMSVFNTSLISLF